MSKERRGRASQAPLGATPNPKPKRWLRLRSCEEKAGDLIGLRLLITHRQKLKQKT